MGSLKNVEIDLGVLGRMVVLQSSVQYFPYSKSKLGLVKNKQTVSGLLETSKSVKKIEPLDSTTNLL